MAKLGSSCHRVDSQSTLVHLVFIPSVDLDAMSSCRAHRCVACRLCTAEWTESARGPDLLRRTATRNPAVNFRSAKHWSVGNFRHQHGDTSHFES